MPRAVSTMPTSRCALLLGALALASAAQAADPAAAEARRLAVGWIPAPGAAPAPAGVALTGIPVRLAARWADVAHDPAADDWAILDAAVASLAEGGARVVLALEPAAPAHVGGDALPGPLDPPRLEAWIRFVRAAARRFAGRVDGFEIAGAGAADAEAYAFLLKASVLALRAESRPLGLEPLVLQGALAARDLARQTELWERDVAAYVDGLTIWLDASADVAAVEADLRRLLHESLLHPPVAPVWAYVSDGAEPWRGAALAVRALALGVSAALLELPADGSAGEETARWAAGAHQALAGGFGPAPLGSPLLEDAAGGPLAGASALGAFLSEDGLTRQLWYVAPGGATPPEPAGIVLDSAFVQHPRLYDPRTGALGAAEAYAVPGRRSPALRIARTDWPRALVYERPAGSAGFDLGPEAVESAGVRELTAEEIIARYQAVQKTEDDHLERWIGEGRIDYHAKLAQGGGTIDVSIDARYFWERGGALEWEETGYYVNGNRIGWKSFPDIPLIQPEKVLTLPLDLTLDKTYRYRSLGRETVGERDAYVLEFEPVVAESTRALYRGRVWIDAERFYRAKVALIQTNLDPPVLSSEEVDRYAERTDPSGQRFWLLGDTSGQQNWSVSGRTVVVRREVTFEGYEINLDAAEFARRKAAAYASRNKIMRDTDEGLRYLEREADGTRSVQDVDTNQWFAAAGAFADSSSDGATPFAGANYFDYDFLGRDIQVNALFGGVVAFVTASKADLFGGRASGTLDAAGSAIYFSDEVFLGEDELEAEQIDDRAQSVALRFGLPIGEFFKLDLVGSLDFAQYDENEDGERAIAAYNAAHPAQSLRFVLPPNHQELSGSVGLEYNRRGFNLIGSASWHRRSEWAAWGPHDDVAGSFVRFDPASASYVAGPGETPEEDYRRWTLSAFREWYLPHFQKLRGELNYLDGAALDRFSAYEFSLFGDDRLNGFAGTGVRFDRGVVARAGYSFNLFEAVRFDASIENAWVEERGSGGERMSFSGAGFSATVVGPWKTVINASYGRAVASDIPELEGADEFFLLLLKLF